MAYNYEIVLTSLYNAVMYSILWEAALHCRHWIYLNDLFKRCRRSDWLSKTFYNFLLIRAEYDNNKNKKNIPCIKSYSIFSHK